MDPCYAAAASPPPSPRLNCLRTQSIFFLRWRSVPSCRRGVAVRSCYICYARAHSSFFVHHDNIIYTHLCSFVYVMHFPICIGHLIYVLGWRVVGCRRHAYAGSGGTGMRDVKASTSSPLLIMADLYHNLWDTKTEPRLIEEQMTPATFFFIYLPQSTQLG
jgi:hypothetical protein